MNELAPNVPEISDQVEFRVLFTTIPLTPLVDPTFGHTAATRIAKPWVKSPPEPELQKGGSNTRPPEPYNCKTRVQIGHPGCQNLKTGLRIPHLATHNVKTGVPFNKMNLQQGSSLSLKVRHRSRGSGWTGLRKPPR
jgi:hypothetical protein